MQEQKKGVGMHKRLRRNVEGEIGRLLRLIIPERKAIEFSSRAITSKALMAGIKT